MPFTWVQSIAVGARYTTAVYTELRTNVDYVKDNPCTSHYTGDNSTQHTGYRLDYDSTHNPINHSTDNGTQHGTHNPAYHPGHELSVLNNYKVADEINHHHNNYGTNHATYHVDHNNPFHSTDDATYDNNDRLINQSDDRATFNTYDGGCMSFNNSNCTSVQAPN